MEKYLQEKFDESFDAQHGYWHEKAKENPADVLKQVDAELKVLYIRSENDQEGRGQVLQAEIDGTMAGLETIRAECLHLLKKLIRCEK